MVLTPEDILNHEFTRKRNSYIATEVDSFLDEVNRDYEQILKENEQLKADKEKIQEQLNDWIAKRDAVNNSILVAQEAAERLKTTTDAKIKQNLAEAQATATKLVNDAKEKAKFEATGFADENVKLVEEQNRLREKVQEFKKTYLDLLEKQKALLTTNELAQAIELLPTSDLTKKLASKPNQAKLVTPTVKPVVPAEAPKEKPAAEETKADDNTKSVNNGPLVVFPANDKK